MKTVLLLLIVCFASACSNSRSCRVEFEKFYPNEQYVRGELQNMSIFKLQKGEQYFLCEHGKFSVRIVPMTIHGEVMWDRLEREAKEKDD